MRKVKVTKRTSNKNTFDTLIEDLDLLNSVPIEGQSLIINSSTSKHGGIVTSPVKMVEKFGDQGFIVYTENSAYKIEYVD